MRLYYLINRIDEWFLRVIYERDSWDESLDEWTASSDDWRVSLILSIVNLAIWISRHVLLLLMMLGHGASCFLSRHMEYHADRCAMVVGGSAALESLMFRLRELDLLQGMGYDTLKQILEVKHLAPDSIPDFLQEIEKRLPARFRPDAQATLINETAGFWATHPTAAQRIRHARLASEPGILSLQKPVRCLFNDFLAASRVVTARHYRQDLRIVVTPPMLRPAADFFAAPHK